MAFDVFGLRDRVVGEYRDYVESFVHIRDPRMNDYVRTCSTVANSGPTPCSSSIPPMSQPKRSASLPPRA